jgi:autoinducer 2 (AI-2) kinase
MLSDWITFRLAGVRVTEPSCGSSSGMFTLADRQWSPSIARACGISPDILPPVVDPGTVVGGVTASAARQTGLRAGTPVVAGGADTQLGLLGAGARAGEYTVVAGTFWQNTVLLDKPLIDPATRLRTLCHVRPGQWMLEGIGFYCGMSMRWFRDAFCDSEVAEARARGVDPYVVMEEAAAQVPPGAHGVLAIMSNLMNARRWVHASPSFLQFDIGDPAATGRPACIRAIEEAAAYVVRGHRDIIAEVTGLWAGEAGPPATAGRRSARADGRRGASGEAGPPATAGRRSARADGTRGGPGGSSPPGSTVFTGGAAKGSLWPQIIADVLATPVHVPVVTESSALGAALCAGVGAGIYASLAELESGLRQRAGTFEPDPAAVTVYDERYQAWRQVYQRMTDLCDDGLLSPLWRAAGA